MLVEWIGSNFEANAAEFAGSMDAALDQLVK
jgi:hypothetical protein